MKREEGIIQARWRMLCKKPLKVYVREAIENFSKNPNQTAELLAIGALTILITGLIFSNKDWLEHTIATVKVATETTIGLENIFGIGPGPRRGAGEHDIGMPVGTGNLGAETYAAVHTTLEGIKKPDWQVWMASYAVAYLLVKQGGQLLGLLEGGLTKVVPMLLGLT
jgi:hypothetical protein